MSKLISKNNSLKGGGFDKLERYELKYHIPSSQIKEMEDFIAPYCILDDYSAKSPDGYYAVNSLYLDSPQLTFIGWKEAGLEDRFNMRIRAYADIPKAPYFFEIKRKIGDMVSKYRGKFLESSAEGLFLQNGIVTDQKISAKDHDNLRRFYRLSQNWNASPKVLTRYKRKAYFSNDLEYARLTFDTQMENRKQSHFDFNPSMGEYRPSDLGENFSPNCNTVLELKCYTTQVPYWMIDLIRHFHLERRSFSKYGSAMHEIMHLDHFFRHTRQAVY